MESYVLAGLAPQAQVDPAGLAFSVDARSQVHSPAGRAPKIVVRINLCCATTPVLVVETPKSRGSEFWQRGLLHEQRGPATVFSVEDFSHVQLSADCLPQEHLACEAQTQSPPERPQQVVGTVIALSVGCFLLVVVRRGLSGCCLNKFLGLRTVGQVDLYVGSLVFIDGVVLETGRRSLVQEGR